MELFSFQMGAYLLRVADLAGYIILVNGGLLQEHVQAAFILSKRMTRNSEIIEWPCSIIQIRGKINVSKGPMRETFKYQKWPIWHLGPCEMFHPVIKKQTQEMDIGFFQGPELLYCQINKKKTNTCFFL